MHLLNPLLMCVSVALPWLNPFAGGPSAAMVPWLVSLACVGGLAAWMVWWPAGRFNTSHGASPDLPPDLPSALSSHLSPHVLLFFAANAVYFVLHSLAHGAGAEGAVGGGASEAVATLVAWGCVALMAALGSALMPTLVRALATTWLVVALVSVGMALLQYAQLEQWLAPWVSHSVEGVAYANLRQRNQFATLCGLGLLALLYLRQTCVALLDTPLDASASASLAPPRPSAPLASFWQRAWPWLAVAVLALGNGLSSSRTGALQWVLIVVAVLCWRSSLRTQVKRLGVASLAVYTAVVALMPWLASAAGNTSTGLWGRAQEAGAVGVTGDARWWLYSNVMDLIALKPWLGWGWRELAYAHYSTPFNVRFTELLDNAHNLPLHLAVELGVPYAALFCTVVVAWIVRARPWRETHPARQLAWGVLMLLGVHSMVEYPLWYGPFLMTLGLCIGLLQRAQPAAYSNNGFWKKKEHFSDVDIKKFAIKLIVIGLLASTAYLAFDYHRLSQIYTAAEQRSPRYAGNALGHAQQSAVFAQQARFAELVTTPVTPQTATRVLTLASALAHYSPEPRVIEPLIESAVMLHFDDIAMFHISRYKAMYPQEYAAWTALR